MDYKEWFSKQCEPADIYRIAAESGTTPPTIRRIMAGQTVAFKSAEAILRALKKIAPEIETTDADIVRVCEGEHAKKSSKRKWRST